MMLFASNFYSQWLLITFSILAELLKTLGFPLKHNTQFSCVELAFFRKEKKAQHVNSFDSHKHRQIKISCIKLI